MSSTGHDHLELEPLALAGVHDPDRPILPGPAQERGDRLQRPLGRRQADPLRRLLGQRREPFQAERQVRAALGAGDGVHLVDDHVLDAAQRLARLAGEQQVEALGGGDQDVRRVLDQLPARIGRRVAGPRRDAHLGQLRARTLGGAADAGQRRPQVALDVVGERLQRRDVQHPQSPLARTRLRLGEEPVEHHRKAASVLPLPVGACSSVCSPAAMAGQPRAWARVGSAKASRNQARVGSENGARGSVTVNASLSASSDGHQFMTDSVLNCRMPAVVWQIVAHATTTERMDDRIRRALSRGHPIDLTTTGRRQGSRGGSSWSSTPSTAMSTSAACPASRAAGWRTSRPIRDVTFHLKGPVQADLPATAREITEPAERRRIMERVAANWGRTDVDLMMTSSPLIEVEIPGLN